MPRIQFTVVVVLLAVIAGAVAWALVSGSPIPEISVTAVDGDSAGDTDADTDADAGARADDDPRTATDGAGRRELATPENANQHNPPIVGRVVDRERRPIPGARIADASLTDDDRAVQADASGTFRYEPLVGGELDLVVSADGHVHEKLTVRGRRQGSALGDVVLERGAIARGTVADESGVPIADVVFSILRDRKGGRAWSGSVRTGADGRFETPRLAPGSHRIAFAAPFDRRFEVVIQGGVDAVTFALTVPRAAAELHGVVVDDLGQPVAGARVHLSAKVRPPPTAELRPRVDIHSASAGWRNRTATTGPDGRFGFFEGTKFDGRIDLSASATGHEPAALGDVPAGADDLRMVLHRGLTLAIDVRDEAGAPIERFAVDLTGVAGTPQELHRSTRSVNPGGRFSIRLPRGSYRGSVRPLTKGFVASETFAVQLQDRDVTHAVVLETGREVTFTIHFSDTTTVAKGRLRVRPDGETGPWPSERPEIRGPAARSAATQMIRSQLSDSDMSKMALDFSAHRREYASVAIVDGRARVRLPERRPLELSVEGSFQTLTRRGFVVTQDEERLVVPNGAVVVGRFVPITNGRVLLRRVGAKGLASSWPPGDRVPVDELGRFRIHEVPPGDWDVCLIPAGRGGQMLPVARLFALTSGETSHVVCDGEVGLSADVVVLPRLDGRDLVRRFVDLRSVSSEATGSVVVATKRVMTGPDGRIRHQGPRTRLFVDVDVKCGADGKLGVLRAPARPDVVPSEPGLQFVDVTTASIALRIVDANEQPIAGRVVALSTGLGDPLTLPATDAEGRVNVARIPTGRLEVLDLRTGSEADAAKPTSLGFVAHDGTVPEFVLAVR